MELIEKLLEKYWAGETTLEEEKAIRTFFHGLNVPPHLESVKPFFEYCQHEKGQAPLGKAFDAKLQERIEEVESSRPVRSLWGIALKVAASILLIGSTVYYFYFSPQEASREVNVITYEDPELAYHQAKETLLLISEKLNAGQKYTAEFKKLGAANDLFKDYENE